MAERNEIPNRMTALGLLEQMRRRASANREPEFNPINATLRGQRQPPLPIPPRPPAVIPPPPPQQAAPQARGQAQALPVPPVPPAVIPQQEGAPARPIAERFNPQNPHVATAIEMAERYGLPRNVFLSLVQQESRFDPNAVSRAGALGLGQLMPGTARDLGVDPTNPTQNLEGSARYLRQQLDRFGGDMPLALAAYNAGPRRVIEAGNAIPDNAETQAYVPSVMRRAGVPGYAEGGPVDAIPVHEINVVATRLPRRRAPRPAPREELTADQLNAMVLDRLAARYDVAPESIMAAEARDRIGRAMGYAEGGRVMSDEEYDRRLLERMKRDTGRTTESTNAEQARALRSAGYDAAQLASDIFLPQSPLDAALMVALGPGGRMARLAGSTALMAMEPSEAEAGGLRRLGTRFVRRSKSFDSPFNRDAEHIAMFAETKNPRETLGQLRSYGPAAWISRGDDAVDVRDIQPDIVRALRNSRRHEDYNTTAATLARLANPENIVDSAGMWDDPQLVREVYENVIQPREITSVRTNDGLLVFDPVNVRPIRTEYSHGGLAQLHHKYAEGGAVSAQPAIYDPDAVNTLANQIEAGYV